MNPFTDLQVPPGPHEVAIQRIQEALLGLTRYQRVTKKDLIRRHLSEIDAAHERGVSFAEIARVLSATGCLVSPRLLRKYLADIRLKDPIKHDTPRLSVTAPAPVEQPVPASDFPNPLPPTVATPIPLKTRSLRRSTLLSTREE